MQKICLMILGIAGMLVAPAFAEKPKVYQITIGGAMVGTTQFEAGQYNLVVNAEERKVQLRDGDGKVVDVPAKIETVDSKFGRTEIHTRKDGETNRIVEIRLGGTKYKISFEES